MAIVKRVDTAVRYGFGNGRVNGAADVRPPATLMATRPQPDIRSLNRRSAHTEIASTIALDVAVSSLPSVEESRERLRTIWDPSLSGRPPEPQVVPADAYLSSLTLLANEGFDRHGSGSLCAVFLSPGAEAKVGIVAHHSVMDGLGLAAVVGALGDTALHSLARGIGREHIARAGIRYAALRAAEAIVRPPTRISPERRSRQSGDVFVRLDLRAQRLDTATLVAAATRAVRGWNRGHSGRVVIAVGASRTSGATISIGRPAAWFRLSVHNEDPAGLREQLARLEPQPAFAHSIVSGRAVPLVVRPLSGRLGSTMLVSNLGRINEPSGWLRSVAFYPFAHGRSGLSLGCCSTTDMTTLTVRARASDFAESGARRFLELVAGEVRTLTR